MRRGKRRNMTKKKMQYKNYYILVLLDILLMIFVSKEQCMCFTIINSPVINFCQLRLLYTLCIAINCYNFCEEKTVHVCIISYSNNEFYFLACTMYSKWTNGKELNRDASVSS